LEKIPKQQCFITYHHPQSCTQGRQKHEEEDATKCNKEEEDDEQSGTSKGCKKNNQKQTTSEHKEEGETEHNKDEEEDKESGTGKDCKKNNQKQTKAQKEGTKSSTKKHQQVKKLLKFFSIRKMYKTWPANIFLIQSIIYN
jgi:hypothetical protein